MIKYFLRAEWGIAVAVVMTFGYAALTADFVALDDFKLIVANPLLQKWNIESVIGMFTSFDPDLYVPFTLLTYHVDRIVAGGFHPWMFHLTNLVLHATNAVLVLRVCQSISGSRGVGVIAGLLFAIHPLHTEAVLWASARKDLLSTLFFLCSLWGYLEYERGMKSNRRNRRLYAVSVVMFLCALLSKVSVVMLPVLLVLIDWYKSDGKGWGKGRVLEKVPYFALSCVFGVIALQGMEGASQGVATILLGTRATFFYLQKLFIPTGLSVLVPFTEQTTIANPELLLSLIGIFCIFGFLGIFHKKISTLTFAFTFFLLSLIPSFGNFVKGNELPLDVYLASDRYTYIPSIGVIFLVSTVLMQLYQKRKNETLLGIACVLCVLSILSFRQSLTWRTTPELYLNVIEHYDNSHLAHNNIGVLMLENGHTGQAIGQFRTSIHIKPNSRAYFNLGRIAELQGDTTTARQAYEASLQHNPRYSDALKALEALNDVR